MYFNVIKGLIALAKKPWAAVRSIIGKPEPGPERKKQEGRPLVYLVCSTCGKPGGTIHKTRNGGYVCEHCMNLMDPVDRAFLFLPRKARRRMGRLMKAARRTAG